MDVYVRLLGLVEGYTLDQLKTAYRRKAHLHHPDRGGDPDIFRVIQEAYDELAKNFEPKSAPAGRTSADSNPWLNWAESIRPPNKKGQ